MTRTATAPTFATAFAIIWSAWPSHARAEPPPNPLPPSTTSSTVPGPQMTSPPSAPPLPAAAAIDFPSAIHAAIAHNTDRRVAIDEITRVAGLLSQATSALLPQVSANATYTRLEGDRFVAGHLEQAANSFEAAIDVSTPIVDLKAYADRRRARDQVEVTAAQADSIKRQVAIATAQAYFSAFSSARFLDIAVHARDLAKASVEYAAQRHASGVGNELDQSRAEAELATDEAQVASATTAKLRAEEALGVITGTDHALAAASEPDLGDPRTGPGIEARADVAAAARSTQASRWSSGHDWLDWVPSLRLTGDGFYTAPVVEPVPQFGYDVAISLVVPIYDGGFRRGAHEQHLAAAAEDIERQVGIERQASSEVRVARAAVEQTRIARDAARHAARLAAHTLDLALTGYHAGTATNLEVVDAERTALDAATQAVIADDDYRQAELDLLAATGAFPPS